MIIPLNKFSAQIISFYLIIFFKSILFLLIQSGYSWYINFKFNNIKTLNNSLFDKNSQFRYHLESYYRLLDRKLNLLLFKLFR